VEHYLKLNELHTLIVGLVGLLIGSVLTRKLPFLRRLSLPVSVLGGVLLSIVVFIIHLATGLHIEFAVGLRDLLLLAFFTTVGLSAKFSMLRLGGKKIFILCGVTVLLLIVQDLIGITIALIKGSHPFYGLLIGSLSFVGGPGTAIAWSAHATSMGLKMAPEIGLGAATMATLAGALIAAPLTNFFARRHRLRSGEEISEIPWTGEKESVSTEVETAAERQIVVFRAFLLLSVAVALGAWVNSWARAHGVILPGFLTAMLGGVLIANGFDLMGLKTAIKPLEQIGAFSLQLFLVLSLMGLQLWVIGKVIMPLMINMVLQVLLAGLIAFGLLFRLLGKDYDALVTSGGFMGFGLASMPVAFATMEEVTAARGPSAMAFLLITLIGSFFVDLANAAITKVFLMLPIFG